MRQELQEKLDKVKDGTSALLLLADVEDPVLVVDEHDGPTMSELADFNRHAHAAVTKHLGVQKAREALMLMAEKEKKEGLGCWACRMLTEFIPEYGDPDLRWVGVA